MAKISRAATLKSFAKGLAAWRCSPRSGALVFGQQLAYVLLTKGETRRIIIGHARPQNGQPLSSRTTKQVCDGAFYTLV
jgi:hypothetical protein